jgi:hypothetical protein
VDTNVVLAEADMVVVHYLSAVNPNILLVEADMVVVHYLSAVDPNIVFVEADMVAANSNLYSSADHKNCFDNQVEEDMLLLVVDYFSYKIEHNNSK